jgi:hypothetical protein
MRFKILGIWLTWLFVMAVLAGVMWVLFMFPLPGGSSGLPSREEVLALFAHLGVGGTITIFAVVFLPPILLTYFEIWKARHSGGLSPATDAGRKEERGGKILNALLRAFLARRIAPRITVIVDPDRFQFEGPGVREGSALQAATALRVGHDLKVGAIGDEALAPAAPGVLIRPFEKPPRHDTPWLHEEPLIHYCRHYLMLASAQHARSFHFGIRPIVTVHKAHTLRSIFRGRETEVLDRVFRAAGASVVTFA